MTNDVSRFGKVRLPILLIALLVGCIMMVAPVAAIHDVSVSIDQPEGPCTDAIKCVMFTIDKGVNKDVNAFLISFPNADVSVPSPINPECINITWYNGTTWLPIPPDHPKDVEVFYGPVPGHPTPPGTTTVKIWTPELIPTNKQVKICFLPCANITMKSCNFTAWASTDLEPYDISKDSDFKSKNSDTIDYAVTIIPSKGGKIVPRTKPPYLCGSQPVFDIIPDPGYEICSVCVNPLVVGKDPCFGQQSEYINGTGNYVYNSTHSVFTFDPLHDCWDISASFRGKVNVYLKYQNSTEDCGQITEIGPLNKCDFIYSTGNISDALDFTDNLYVGGNESEFYLNSTKNFAHHTSYGEFDDGAWDDGPPVGEAADIVVPSVPPGYHENEKFQVTVYLNDGSEVIADPVSITGVGSYPIKSGGSPITNIVNVKDVVGINAGNTCLYQDFFAIWGQTYSTYYGNYGYPPYPQGEWTDGESLGENVKVDIEDPPASHSGETYVITYIGDDGTIDNHATLIIVNDEVTIWWAPQNNHTGPTNIVDITNVQPQMPAWHLVTQCFLDDNPDFEGLIGAIIVVEPGTYGETFEMDTPGVVLKSRDGAATTIIDAKGIQPQYNATEYPGRRAAVLITAGCTEFNGFTVVNAGICPGFKDDEPDIDGNGYMDTAGIVIHPSSWKCQAALIDNKVSCHDGRVNIINNTIRNSSAEGILANYTAILVEGNKVFYNCWDGFAGEELHCGTECIDPFAFTHCYGVASEIIYNEFHDNGCGKMSKWEGKDCKNASRTSFSTAFLDPPKNGDPFWIDSGIEIRSVLCCYQQAGEIEPFSKGKTMPNIQPALVFSDPFIIGNKIYNNTHAGINLLEDALPEGCDVPITIIENKISNNSVFGISSFVDNAGQMVPVPDDGSTERLVIKYNDITGNKWWGIKNFFGIAGPVGNNEGIIIAKENWWGKIGGPSKGPLPICHEPDQQSIALGNGNAVSHYVHYNPWLTQTYSVVMANDPVRWYGSDTLELQEGWNTLSVPLTLDDRADNITEIGSLGCFLTPQNFVVAYQFNANTHLFEPITPNLIPARGYYIKMKEGTRFPVLYSGSESPGLPAFPLNTGWNLVGSAFGIDRRDDETPIDEGRWAVANPDAGIYGFADPEAVKRVIDALDSLESEVPRGLSTVVSPSVPGQISSWSASENNLDGKRMYTGEGYWVYMVNPGTLSGFEITPFHFTFDLDGFGCVCPGVP